MGSCEWGYKSPYMGYNYSCLAYNCRQYYTLSPKPWFFTRNPQTPKLCIGVFGKKQ